MSGDHFTINGSPKFLLMVSYFDALDVPQPRLVRDFSQFQAWGIDGIRIFPNWLTYNPSTFAGDTVIDEAGNLRPGPLSNLEQVLSLASNYGLVVDVTLTADTIGPADQPSSVGSSITYSSYRNGVVQLISYLNGHGYFNVMYDLQNEHTRGGNGPQNVNLSSGPSGQLADIVAAAKGVTDQPVFVSVESNDGSIAGNEALSYGENAVAYHEPRSTGWWTNTAAVVNAARNASGGKPVYLQEPGRIGDPGSCCSASDFRAAYDAAANAGAAAWTFHSTIGHYMNVTDYLDQLASAESVFLSTVRSGGGGTGGTTLTAGHQLNPGQAITSPNGQYTLTYQTDGNLVLYGPSGALWHTGTFGTCAGAAIMQGDGNFVVYDCGGTPLWSSGTPGNPGAYVSVQDDSNLVVYAANGQPLWWRWM